MMILFLPLLAVAVVWGVPTSTSLPFVNGPGPVCTDDTFPSWMTGNDPVQNSIPIHAKMCLPSTNGTFGPGPPFASPWPVVIVLHGSGGLYKTPAQGSNTLEFEKEFRQWYDWLTTWWGVAAYFPDSYSSRGFFDWNEAENPDGEVTVNGVEYGQDARDVWRLLDTKAALKRVCEYWGNTLGKVDCRRTAVFGASNGGSGVMLGMLDLTGTPSRLVGVSSALVPNNSTHFFKFGIAYYTGCGWYGLVSSSEKQTDHPKMYWPYGSTYIFHASKDSLLDKCYMRDNQVKIVATAKNTSPRLTLKVYQDASHGFMSKFGNDGSTADKAAKADALTQTRKLLCQHGLVTAYCSFRLETDDEMDSDDVHDAELLSSSSALSVVATPRRQDFILMVLTALVTISLIALIMLVALVIVVGRWLSKKFASIERSMRILAGDDAVVQCALR